MFYTYLYVPIVYGCFLPEINVFIFVSIEASECISKLNSDSADGRRKVPGWLKEVEHLKHEALFWHRL